VADNTPRVDSTPSYGEGEPQPAAALPTGTLTFCFTDIEGSAQLWEKHPHTMPQALARHDALIRAATEASSGVVFKTVGDSLHAVFARATDALAAALAAQRALQAEPWGPTGPLRVRMAFHSGVAEERDRDYFGPTLNRVARILALGHGGQILLARATVDLVVDDLPPQAALRDLGTYHLKDLTRLEQIFQLVSPDLPADFPPLRSAGNAPTPAQSLPLLTTKLYVPPARPNLVPRPRLTARLQAGVTGKLTLIAAPAGFGKTTLINAWHAAVSSALPLAWVALDAGDNDPIRFWSYVIAALDTLHAGVGTAPLALLQSPQPPPIESILTALLNTVSGWTTDVALVLDDYHLIDAPPIHQALALLLDHLPSRLHLVIATRADPPLPLGRLRARGELTELRADDLRFTPAEAAAFLTEVMRLPLSAKAVAALETRTEGWIAGLQFAALAMRDRTDLAGFVAAFTGSNRFVVDYLAEEVLLHLPQHLQTFLLQTAILDRMCGPLCDTLLRGDQSDPLRATSQTLLEGLERANLFIVPLDDTRQWYRYHHLFVDVLRGRLAGGATTERVARLHRRASAWFEDHGFVAEAVQHALAVSDWDQAARLVELHGDAVWMRGELATLMRWLMLLPDTAFEKRPKLALNHAFILSALDALALSERRVAAAERALHAGHLQDMPLLGQAAVCRTVIALLADGPAEATIAAGRRALEILPESSTTWRGHANMLLGVGYYAQAGNVDLGLQTLAEAERVGLLAADAFTVANAAAHTSIVLEICGQLHASKQRNQHYLERASEPFWQGVPLAGYARFGLSRVLYEHNDLRAAYDQLTEAIPQLEAWSLKRPLIVSCVLLARVHQAMGEPEPARERMGRAIAIVQKDNLKQTFSHWEAYQARMDLAQGSLAAAARWGREIEPSASGELNPAHEFDHITLAQVYLAQHRLDDAQGLLARLLPAAQAAGRLGRALAIRVLQALTADAQGDQVGALTILERALTLAEPEGYVRTFVDEGAPMAVLLAHVARGESPVAAYAATLLAAFPAQTKASDRRRGDAAQAARHTTTTAALVEPLSSRELEVLRLIADGHSNQAIADILIVAVSTVKRHVNNIYGKLDVQSRTQALVRARELNLL
jgi:LuxR family maltose regulon positive regulatory protein